MFWNRLLIGFATPPVIARRPKLSHDTLLAAAEIYKGRSHMFVAGRHHACAC